MDRYDSSGHIRARETIYNGITMRSRLEAACAQWLDTLKIMWTYEGTAFASPAGQYLPDFTVHGANGRTFDVLQFFEVKPEGHGTEEVLERMKIILATHPKALLGVIEGSWVDNGYKFKLVREWPPVVTYYVYNVPGCDSWHGLPQPTRPDPDRDPSRPYWGPTTFWDFGQGPEKFRQAAEQVLPEIDGWDQQEPKVYILPAADDILGEPVWAVAFHKGDAALVSRIPLPWLNEYLVSISKI